MRQSSGRLQQLLLVCRAFCHLPSTPACFNPPQMEQIKQVSGSLSQLCFMKCDDTKFVMNSCRGCCQECVL